MNEVARIFFRHDQKNLYYVEFACFITIRIYVLVKTPNPKVPEARKHAEVRLKRMGEVIFVLLEQTFVGTYVRPLSLV